MSDNEQAIKWLEEGKEIKRTNWKIDGEVHLILKDGKVFDCYGKEYRFDYDDLKTKKWMVYKKKLAENNKDFIFKKINGVEYVSKDIHETLLKKDKEDFIKEEVEFLRDCINNTNSVRKRLKKRIGELLKNTENKTKESYACGQHSPRSKMNPNSVRMD